MYSFSMEAENHKVSLRCGYTLEFRYWKVEFTPQGSIFYANDRNSCFFCVYMYIYIYVCIRMRGERPRSTNGKVSVSVATLTEPISIKRTRIRSNTKIHCFKKILCKISNFWQLLKNKSRRKFTNERTNWGGCWLDLKLNNFFGANKSWTFHKFNQILDTDKWEDK